MADASAQGIVTAAILVIGDEILSGRTKDKNIGHIAERATALGIDLREVRVVPDVEEEIVAAVNALRARYAEPDQRLVLLVGRLVYEKGFHLALDGAAFPLPLPAHEPRPVVMRHGEVGPARHGRKIG